MVGGVFPAGGTVIEDVTAVVVMTPDVEAFDAVTSR